MKRTLVLQPKLYIFAVESHCSGPKLGYLALATGRFPAPTCSIPPPPPNPLPRAPQLQQGLRMHTAKLHIFSLSPLTGVQTGLRGGSKDISLTVQLKGQGNFEKEGSPTHHSQHTSHPSYRQEICDGLPHSCPHQPLRPVQIVYISSSTVGTSKGQHSTASPEAT